MLGTGYSSTTEMVCMSGTRSTRTLSLTINGSGTKEKADWELSNMWQKYDCRNKSKYLVVSVSVNELSCVQFVVLTVVVPGLIAFPVAGRKY